MAPHRIDTHIHIIPDRQRQAIIKAGGDPSGWYIPAFSPEMALEFMDKIDVQRAVWSITAPGPAVLGTGPEAHQHAVQCNQDVATLCGQHPDRFSYFASLPSFVDVKGCLDTIEKAVVLDPKPLGVVIMTSYSGKLIGDEAFDAIWQKLNDNHMVVFVHPSSVDIEPHMIASVLPQPTIDYPQQTTRAAIDLLLRGHLRRFRDLKVILSHAGGTLPMLVQRCNFSMQIPELVKRLSVHAGVDHQTFMEDVKRFYFDVAMSTSRIHLYALLQITSIDRILFGSDWPYAYPDQILRFTAQFNQLTEPGAEFAMYQQANAENARRLFKLD